LFWELRLFWLAGVGGDLKPPNSSHAKALTLITRMRKGKTALHHGVEKEFDPALLKWLLKRGASPTSKIATVSPPE